MSGKKTKKTRHSSGEAAKAVGGPSSLPQSELPLLKEIFALEKQLKDMSKIVTTKELLDGVYDEIIVIYKKVNSNLPLISEKRGKENLNTLHDKYKKLIRSGTSSQKFKEFQSKLDSIFDLIACKCDINTCEAVSCDGCENGAHITCKCTKDKKIPLKELSFVLDQRNRVGGKGKMQLGALDAKETNRMEKNLLKKQKKKYGDDKQGDLDRIQPHEEEGEEDTTKDDDYFYFDEPEPEPKKVTQQNRMKLRNAAKECVRWNVSPRGGAAIISAALVDYGIVTENDTALVVDKNKLRREIEAFQNELKEEQMLELSIKKPGGFWFDGKKDDTLCVETDSEGKKKNVVKKEEHVSVISEPGGQYVTHLTPPGGKGVEIAKDLTCFLQKFDLLESWDVIGADSTAVNTGKKTGVIATVEKITGKRKLSQICQLHLNELPLRHCFCDIDGETDSKNTFKGKIGKMLPSVHDMQLVDKFPKVDIGEDLPELTNDVVNDLSSDQYMLYLAWDSVRSGNLRKELLSLTPGPISHSRWLTLALRLLLLHMTDHKLKGKHKKNLQDLVSFLMTNYIPMWFTIKRLGRLQDSAQVLFKQIQLIKLLKKPIADIVKKNVERNAYSAQSETLLLCMLCDSDPIARCLAVDRILSLRQGSETGDTSVRLFTVPQLVLNCKHYYDMIDWDKEDIFEPVLTSSLSLAELAAIKAEPLSIPNYPNHAQACERQVKQTSIAAMQVAGFESRDGYIRASAVSRKLMGKFESKQDFVKKFL